ncbi:hypothetical protein DSL64_02000 [Dyadobacter luteus]|uniref:Uncharacterized protein n=1 Tax=Dyadobacter luteus TaxID=2259619 RepID=A0A3D8YHP5_9BACT|nr:hypothetical protein DSL64_02000 [Dyadobacter luteus]
MGSLTVGVLHFLTREIGYRLVIRIVQKTAALAKDKKQSSFTRLIIILKTVNFKTIISMRLARKS